LHRFLFFGPFESAALTTNGICCFHFLHLRSVFSMGFPLETIGGFCFFVFHFLSISAD
jgi:hypothetical protein